MNMSRMVMLFLVTILYPYFSFSQSYFIKFFFDSTNVNISVLGFNADSNLILVGNSNEFLPGQNLHGVSVISIDTLGNQILQYRIFELESSFQGPNVRVFKDALLMSGSTPQIQGSLVRANATGTEVLSIGFGDTLNWTNNTDAQILESGSLIVVGTNRDFSDNNFDICVAKYNPTGTLLFGKRIDIDAHDVASNLQIVNSDQLLITGITNQLLSAGNQLFIVRMDSLVNVLNSYRYSIEFGIQRIEKVLQMPDSSLFLLLQCLDSIFEKSFPCILKLDKNLNPLWLQKIVTIKELTGTDLEARNNNILLSGNLESETDSGVYTNGLVTELASDGEIQWSKQLMLYGRNSLDAVAISGNTLFLAGHVVVDPTEARAFFISKTFAGNALGCEEEVFADLSTEFMPVTISDAAQVVSSFGRTYPVSWDKTLSGTLSNYCADNAIIETFIGSKPNVYPVPSDEIITFDFSNINASAESIIIFNMQGIEVMQVYVSSSHISLPVLAFGADAMYFYKVTYTNKAFSAGKILIQR